MREIQETGLILDLQNAFEIFNKDLFSGSLADPVFTFNLDKNVVLRFVKSSHSIIIGSKLTKTNAANLKEHLLHEMVHMWNEDEGVADCTSNQYHNKKFLHSAMAVGFCVSRHPSQGWEITKFSKSKDCQVYLTVNARLLKIANKIKFDEYCLKETKTQISRVVKSQKKRVCFLKYVCKCSPPHNSIRSGRRPDGPNSLQIKCLVCKNVFECV